jgi:hypothetical protein
VEGYVALLDVLGFSALVGSDRTGQKIQGYLDCLQRATDRSEVGYVVFSDSIVLTTKGASPESLITVARACSRLLSDLLDEGIPLRGTIAFGDFLRSSIGESVFVAGRAVIEAYEFEQAQKWVGVMLAPSVLTCVQDLADRCSMEVGWLPDGRLSVKARLPWPAFIQPCRSIPFESGAYDGFAIVPTNGEIDFAPLRESIMLAIKRLVRLRSIAPSPASQSRYNETLTWLRGIQESWYTLIRVEVNEQQQRET